MFLYGKYLKQKSGVRFRPPSRAKTVDFMDLDFEWGTLIF
jgi:hypothetical protein